MEPMKGEVMRNRFDYVKYDETAAAQQAAFKSQFQAMETLVETLGGGRAKALVLTKLEEAYMWVGKAIRDEQVLRVPSTPPQEGRNDE